MARTYVGRLRLGGLIALCAVLLLAPPGQGQITVQRKTFTISGTVGGQSGVTMQGLPGSPQTDQNGVYTATVEIGWSGTVTPVKVGYTFEPAQKVYTNVEDNITQNYIPKLQTFAISGSVDVPNVTLRGFPNPVTSGQDGRYTASVQYGWSGLVTPEKLGYRFEPSQKSYSNVTRDTPNENYTAEELTYTIAGNVGAKGVLMKGLPGEVVSGEGGDYQAKVPYGFSGTVTPTRPGHHFTPESMDYTMVDRDYPGQDYGVQIDHYMISGSVGQANVVLNGLPDSPISDLNGQYQASVPHGFSGTITPELPGYTFQPPSREYTDVAQDKLQQDYAASRVYHTIAGNAGMPGVRLRGLPGEPVSDSGGGYTAKVEYGWTGVVTPEKQGYTFDPPTQTYTSVTSDQLNQNYKPSTIKYTISGNVGQDKVILRGLPGTVMSGPDGSYNVEVPHGWSGTVTPVKAGFTFDPNERSYEAVTSAQFSQDFYPQPIRYKISGTVRDEGMTGVAGVQILSESTGSTTATADSATTDADGKYELLVDYGWQGRLTPRKEGHTFAPTSRPFTQPVNRDYPNQDFLAKVEMFTITNKIQIAPGEPIAGIKVTPVPSEQAKGATTGNDGIFRVQVPYGWSGELKFEHREFDFGVVAYSNVTSDINELAPKPTTPPTGSETTPPPTGSGTTPPPTGTGTTPPPTGSGTTPPPTGTETTPPPTGSGTTPPPTGSGTTPPPTGSGTTPPPPTGTDGASREQMLTQIAQLRQDLASLYQQALTISQQGGVIPTEMQQRISQYEQQIDRLQGQLDGTGGGQAAPTPPPAEEGPDEEWPDLTTVGPGGRITGSGSGRVVSEQPRMTLLDVLTRISEDTGEDIAVDATVKDQPITVGDLTGLSVPAALERILQQTEYTYKSQDGAYLVFKPITNTFSGDALRDALDLISLSTGVQISASANVVHDVYAQLEGVDLETALDKVLAGSPYVAKRFPNYYLVADRTFESDVFPEISVTRHVRLNYMSPQTVLSLLAPPFAQYVRAENAPDPNFAFAAGPIQQQNRGQILTITAAPKVAEQIVQQIKALDMRPRQVLLESRVVVLEHGDLLNLGVQWGFPTIQAGSFFGSILNDDDEVNNETMSGIQIGYTPDSTFTSALRMALNLLEETSQAEIMSNPQVFAQHGREAQIRVVTEEWFFMTAQQGDVFGFTRGELEKIESGTVLTITPFIGDNNDITLEMAVEVSDSIPRGRGSELPVVTRRTARNAVTIEDGGTVALAGLTENRVRSKEQRVPFLSDLPGVGGLFRNSDDDESTREIAVFVTANLVPERGRGGLQRGARRPEPSIRDLKPEPAPLSMEDQIRDAMMRRRNR